MCVSVLQLKIEKRRLSVCITLTLHNANLEVSNTNYVDPISDILGRLAAMSECMAGTLRTRLVVGEGIC